MVERLSDKKHKGIIRDLSPKGDKRLSTMAEEDEVNQEEKPVATLHISQVVHVSSGTLDWLDAQNIRVLPWPACSPDLNPVENLWDILVRSVYAKNRCYDNVGELTAAVFQVWANIDQNTITRLIITMHKLIFELFEKK
uniref:Tc1-like transposase DDE domain-containing protein n=1 Tax=Phlebotomus papatasi TaxID=29031 RepID=A0A1B0CZ71_PHLPP